MSEHETPSSIDRKLRNVALPPGLLPRLREISAMGDVELDFLIRTVPLPEGTLDRLREIGSLSDADLDGELCDVELPRGMQHRIDRAMRWQAQRAQFIGWAVAASLLAIVTGVAYWAGGDRNVAQQTVHPPRVESHVAQSNGNGQPGNQVPQLVPQKNQVAGNQSPKVPTESPGPKQPSTHGITPAGSDHGATGLVQGTVPVEPISIDPETATLDTATPDTATDANPSSDVQPARQQSIFGGDISPVPPNLSVVQAPMSRGVSGPRVEGYDAVYELRSGRHPFVAPASNRALKQSRVPIWTNTASYESACRIVAHGQLPPPGQIHTEDFLAAMDYGFPLPTAAPVGIRTSAGPAPWGPPGMSLMQIGVQAARMPREAGDTHLTLVLDASAAMLESGRAELVRRALVRLTEQMTPRDRVSIAVFNSRAQWLVRQASQEEMRRVLSAWNESAWSGAPGKYVNLDGLADMAAGIELAAGDFQPVTKTPSHATAKPAEKIVLIADSLEPIDDRSLPHLRELLHGVVDTGVKWEMVGLSQDPPLSPQWDELAQIGGHLVRHANTPDELFQRLHETLAGRSQVVAASVEMKVTFDPAAVLRYRLIGHESNSGGGLFGAPLEADLRSGQAATALYEVELKPDGPTVVAFVEVSWRDPISDAPRRIRQPISRLEFLTSWRECALPLQTAAIAAATADVLRSSNMLPANARVLDQVAALASAMNPALSHRPNIVRLKQLIDEARTAKPARSAGRS